jgi:hypothetical protein
MFQVTKRCPAEVLLEKCEEQLISAQVADAHLTAEIRCSRSQAVTLAMNPISTYNEGRLRRQEVKSQYRLAGEESTQIKEIENLFPSVR